MKKAVQSLVKVEAFVASLTLAALIIVTFAGVIARYILGNPFTWEEEFQLACMVWISFLAAPIAFHTGSHVAIEILVEMFPKKVQAVVEILIAVIVYIVLIYAMFRCIDFIRVIYRTGRSTPILKIPYFVVYGIAPLSFVLMLINYTYTTAENYIHRFIKSEEGL